MPRNHNKKRNVGIIYELLLRNISNLLIQGDKKSAKRTLKIIESRFNKDSELYREFRLFNALIKSTVSDSAVAAAILTEAKSAARRCDSRKLDREKSLLIKEINHTLGDKMFYHRRVPEYQVYATIQTLLNDWRSNDRSDLSRTVQYESKVIERMLSEKDKCQTIEENIDHDVDSLVVKIMTEKINEKYKNNFCSEQRDIIRSYVFSMSHDGGTSILEKVQNIKDQTLNSLNEFEKKTDNGFLLEKIDSVRQRINDESINEMNDESIARFLTLIQLKRELREAIYE